MQSFDVVTIGGGVYGCFLSTQVAQEHPGHTVALLERSDRLFTGAASTNQGQLHMGYLYGGNERLAADCLRNMPLFERYFGEAVDHDVTAYYAIHRGSALSPDEYERFCGQVGLPLLPADDRPAELFGDEMAAVYRTPEKTSNSARLGAVMAGLLDRAGVEVRTSQPVERIEPTRDGRLTLSLHNGDQLTARVVINATFAGINGLHERSRLPLVPTKYDVLLHFLVDLPPAYEHVGGSVVAGRYAFLSPSTFRDHHILASARYRTIASGVDRAPTEAIDERRARDLYAKAVAESRAWLPVLRRAEYRGYTVGTSVKYRDPETGRDSPDVVAKLNFGGVDNYHVIVAGRVSCVFDALEPVRQAMKRAPKIGATAR